MGKREEGNKLYWVIAIVAAFIIAILIGLNIIQNGAQLSPTDGRSIIEGIRADTEISPCHEKLDNIINTGELEGGDQKTIETECTDNDLDNYPLAGGNITACTNNPNADIFEDGVVNLVDLNTLIASWGTSASNIDLDGDGIVGINDLLILLANWGPVVLCECYDDGDCPDQLVDYCDGSNRCISTFSFECDNPGKPDAECAEIDQTPPSCETCEFGCANGLCCVEAGCLSYHEGWPIHILGFPNPVISGSSVGDIDGDGDLEIVVKFKGDNFATATVLYAYHEDGSLVFNTDDNFPDNSMRPPSLGDIDGDGAAEIVVGSTEGVYVFDGDGSLMPGWPKETSSQFGYSLLPILEDMDNDGILDIVAPAHIYPEPNVGKIFIWKGNGELIREITLEVGGGLIEGIGVIWDSGIADLDGDGDKEIIVVLRNEETLTWEISTINVDGSLEWVTTYAQAPVILGGYGNYINLGDVDNDGKIETIAFAPPTDNGATAFIRILDENGNIEYEWFPETGNKGSIYRYFDAALGDLDGDNDLEIILQTNENAHTPDEIFSVQIWHHNGILASEFQLPPPFDEEVLVPTIFDVNNDGKHDILSRPYTEDDINFEVFAYNIDGEIISGWPISFVRGFSQCGLVSGFSRYRNAISDIDQNGQAEYLSSISCSEFIILDLPASYDGLDPGWPMHKHDARHTNNYNS